MLFAVARAVHCVIEKTKEGWKSCHGVAQMKKQNTSYINYDIAAHYMMDKYITS